MTGRVILKKGDIQVSKQQRLKNTFLLIDVHCLKMRVILRRKSIDGIFKNPIRVRFKNKLEKEYFILL